VIGLIECHFVELGMKRLKKFYETVSIDRVVQNNSISSYRLMLDGRQVRTPLGDLLILPNEAVAAAVAAEWQLQSSYVVPNSMPISTVLMTNIDVDSKQDRSEHLTRILRYFQTDTVRFPENDRSKVLFSVQKDRWRPIFEYFAMKGVSISQSSTGLALPESTQSELQTVNDKILSCYDSLGLSVLETASKYLKSGSLAVGLLDGKLCPEEAFKAAFVEELCQRDVWGLVEGDHDLNQSETMLWLHGLRLVSSLLKR